MWQGCWWISACRSSLGTLKHCCRTNQNMFFAWCLSVALSFSRLERSVQQNSIKASVHPAGNEWGALRGSQPTDKEVLIDLVLSLSVSLCNFITIKWRLQQITGAPAPLCGTDWTILFSMYSHTMVSWISYEKSCTLFHALSYVFNQQMIAPTDGLDLGHKK